MKHLVSASLFPLTFNHGFIFLGTKDLIEVSNHPVHIQDINGTFSPTALIPFCGFGGNMTGMGVMIDQFDIPVCNSFRAKILNDQLCYVVDLNRYSDKINIDKELRSGFSLLLDYNEDRQATFDGNNEGTEDFFNKIIHSDEDMHATIYLDTIGKF